MERHLRGRLTGESVHLLSTNRSTCLPADWRGEVRQCGVPYTLNWKTGMLVYCLEMKGELLMWEVHLAEEKIKQRDIILKSFSSVFTLYRTIARCLCIERKTFTFRLFWGVVRHSKEERKTGGQEGKRGVIETSEGGWEFEVGKSFITAPERCCDGLQPSGESGKEGMLCY